MNYIVKFHNDNLSYDMMYMVAPGHWTPKFSEATIKESFESARNFVYQQYPSQDGAWDYLTILEYTDQEYFKTVLKG